jgi:prepilin-type processing-associated H-X9-DG protein
LGTALLDYEGANRQLPAAGSYGNKSAFWTFGYWRFDLKAGTNHSWVVPMLPYLGEQPLYSQFDLNVNVMENYNEPQAHQPPTLLCPSDNAWGRYFEVPTSDPDRTVRFGKANYAAFSNVYHVDSWFYPAAIFHIPQKVKDFTDGTSSTLVFSEIRTRGNRLDQRGAWALPWSGTSLLAFDMHPTVNATGAYQVAPPYTPADFSLGSTQVPNGIYPDVLFECPDLAGEQFDRMPCTTSPGYISAAPRSQHPTGVNAVFLDGHVGFLPNNIDEKTMLYMVHPSDGETGYDHL